ncbi:hypothetical protein C8R41DRAFT_981415 [Lentinula lateritia]|uniref:MYND-type domain-containing protein n=1 Tax=Lentinula lateritia TaxID=40482 RepID=A0ABQ8VF24_9AGAR|nr:hypothetical protein C8R41DRAFT_981415 [Lentinula lateritia]
MSSLPSGSSSMNVKFVHTQVPTPNNIFDDMPPKEVVKNHLRPIFQEHCELCKKSNTSEESPAVRLRRCGKCKLVWYCSKKCQQEHWPLHKSDCSDNPDDAELRRIVMRILAQRLLRGLIEVFCITSYDIINTNHRPSRSPKLPYLLRIDLGVEPAEISKFMEIFHPQTEVDSNPPPGMVQVNAITHSEEYVKEYFSRSYRKDSRYVEESVDDNMKSKNGLPVMIMEFVLRGDVSSSVSVFTSLTPQAMEVARKRQPYTQLSSIRGTFKVPFSADSTIECLNGLIRDDKTDKFLLRIPMKPYDVGIISAAGRKDFSHSKAVEYLLVKMKRDRIYTPIAYNFSSR